MTFIFIFAFSLGSGIFYNLKRNTDIELILGQGVRRAARPDKAYHLDRACIIHFQLKFLAVLNIVGPLADDRPLGKFAANERSGRVRLNHIDTAE